MKEKSSQTSCFYFLPSRKVRVRDINASPISRITNFRDDEGRQSGMMEGTALLNNSHSRVFLSGISTVCEQRKWRRSSTTTFEDDPRRSLAEKVRGGLYPSPVAAEGRGFTLIELLIAVLIIGILVAVAVPQYQKAVLKSRFSSLMPLGKALQGGNEAYYLEHGSYTNDPTNLDVRANNSNAQITLGNEERHKYVLLTRNDINNNLRIYQQRSQNFPGETHCEALIDNAQANWLCRDALKGTLVGNKYGYTVYSLSPETEGTLVRTYEDVARVDISDGDVCVDLTGGSCRGTYNNAKCIARNNNYACGATGTWYRNHSVCIGNGQISCGHGTNFTDHSVCISNAPGACDNSRLTDHSICYQVNHSWNDRGCNRGNVTYDETSCCAGEYCTRDRCEDKGITPPDVSIYLNN